MLEHYPWLPHAGAALASLVGLVLLWRGLFGDPRRRERRCPKCWYDLRSGSMPAVGTGTGDADPPLRPCPECGHLAKSERALHRARRRWWLILPGLALLLALPGVDAYHRNPALVAKLNGTRDYQPPPVLVNTTHDGPWRLRWHADPADLDNESTLRNYYHLSIWHGPRRVARIFDGALDADPADFKDGPPHDADLDGDGKPDLILTGYSGGAHCCSTAYLVLSSAPGGPMHEIGTADSDIV